MRERDNVDQMPLLTNKKATARTPQVVTLIVDDSDSMRGLAEENKSKAEIAAESIKDIIVTTQAKTQESTGYRFLLNIAKFGNAVMPIAEAQAPRHIVLNTVAFSGNSGTTNMAAALEWGATALEKALGSCRTIPEYDEKRCPAPLVIFLSDGDNTGPEIDEPAARMRDVYFEGGKVNVIACGIGMKPEHFSVMRLIASHPEFAINIKPDRLGEFLAVVGATMEKPNVDHIGPFRERENTEQLRETEPPPPGPEDLLNGTEPPPPGPEYELPHTERVPIEPEVVPPKPPVPQWEIHMKTGRTALHGKQYAEAESAFMAARDEVKSQGDSRLAATLSSLANLHIVQNNHTKARPFVDKGLDLLSQLGPSAEGLAPAEALAEHLTLLDEQGEADALWARIAKLGSTGPVARAGELAAAGFVKKAERNPAGAAQLFEQAIQANGVGSLAALKGMVSLKTGRAAAQPYLEKLEDELAKRYGLKHPATVKAYAKLRGFYGDGYETEKLKQLDRKHK